jgi:hypothetical protein
MKQGTLTKIEFKRWRLAFDRREYYFATKADAIKFAKFYDIEVI